METRARKLAVKAAKIFEKGLRKVAVSKRTAKKDAWNPKLLAAMAMRVYTIKDDMPSVSPMLKKMGFKVVMKDEKLTTYTKDFENGGKRCVAQVRGTAANEITCKFYVTVPKAPF